MDEPAGMLEQSLEQNLMAPFRMARELIPLLLKADQPRLINVSSGAGTMDALREPAIASYRLSKWALNGLTLLQARQYAGRLHISAFDPGWIKTDLGGPNAPGTPEEAAEGLLKTDRFTGFKHKNPRWPGCGGERVDGDDGAAEAAADDGNVPDRLIRGDLFCVGERFTHLQVRRGRPRGAGMTSRRNQSRRARRGCGPRGSWGRMTPCPCRRRAVR